jgi:hypothetical protein
MVSYKWERLMSIMIKRLDGPTAGQVYLEREDVAENLIMVGSAVRATFDDTQRAVPSAVETPESSSALSDMKVKTLKNMAEAQGLEVKGTGVGGRVTRTDLEKALS